MENNSYESDNVMIGFVDVSHVDKGKEDGGAIVVMACTTWNAELGCYNNAAWLDKEEVAPFIDQYNAFLNSRNGVIIHGVVDTLTCEPASLEEVK